MKRLLLISAVLLCFVFILSLSASANTDTVTLTAGGDLNQAITSVPDGGTIHIEGTYALPSSFSWATHNKSVTITGGVLDATALSGGLVVGDNVTFADITLTLTAGANLFANGHKLTVKETVTLTNPINVYGGGKSGSTISSTHITLLAGTYNTIYGGSYKGTVTGNTYVYVGGTVNASIDETDHSLKYYIYGGGNEDTVRGDTQLTVAGSTKATLVFGGSYKGTIGGTAKLNFTSGAAMGLYGGSNNAGSIGGVQTTITGGHLEQVFGGNQSGSLTANIDLRVLGGTITRRIYGGCYNNTNIISWSSSHHVTGTIVLTIGGDANITLDYSDLDRGIYARSRYKSAHSTEKAIIVFADNTAYTKYKNSLGTKDYMVNVSAADETHYYTYTANGATITQACAYHADHAATATLTLDPTVSLIYTGNAIEAAATAYSSDWAGDRPPITYTDNVNAGTATASVTLNGLTVTIPFTIEKADAAAPTLSAVHETILNKKDGRIEGLSSDMEYTIDGVTYVPVTDPNAALAAGTYGVRVAATANYKASLVTTVVINAGTPLRVTFVADNRFVDSLTVGYGQALTDIPAVPAKEGFVGVWNRTSFENITSNVTVTAVYTALQHTITFVADGRVVATKTVAHGQTLYDIPTIPHMEGYSVTAPKWDITDFSSITTDLTVTAIYTADPPVADTPTAPPPADTPEQDPPQEGTPADPPVQNAPSVAPDSENAGDVQSSATETDTPGTSTAQKKSFPIFAVVIAVVACAVVAVVCLVIIKKKRA